MRKNRNLSHFLAGLLAAGSIVGSAEALTVNVFAEGQSYDYTGQFEIPERFLPSGLPLSDGAIVPVENPIFFESRALRTYFWGNERADGTGPADNRFEAGPTGDRLILDDGNRTLTLNLGSDFNGRSMFVTGSATASQTAPETGAITITTGTVETIPVPPALAGLALGLALLLGIGRRRPA